MIGHVKGLDTLLKSAVSVRSEAELLSQIQQLDLIAKMHAQKPVKQFHAFQMPTALLHDGHFVGIAAIDLVQTTSLLERYTADFRKQVPDKTAALLVTGNVSPAAREQIKNANIELIKIAQSGANKSTVANSAAK